MSRGTFAKMDTEKLREIARKGGIAAQRKGTAHRFRTREEAAEAGRKGGIERGRRRREAKS